VQIQEMTPELAASFGLKTAKGALVVMVEAGGPAHEAGSMSGDVILKVGGKVIESSGDPPQIIAATAPGTEAATDDSSMGTKLFGNLRRDVDRDRERHAHVAAACTVDHRVYADDLAAQVEQRTTRVARVDRHVGLDEGNEALVQEKPPLRAHDPGRHAVLKPERRADGRHPLAHLELGRVADRHFAILWRRS
jgi:hypothetical protein